MTTEIDQQIEFFFTNTITATSLLYRNNLYGQLLVLIYSFIDSAGLLDAPPSQTQATRDSFKNWVKKYILTDAQINFNEVDLWSARCAVLHTFTSQSNLSNAGTAKELHYYAGPNDSDTEISFIEQINSTEQIPVHLDGFYSVLLSAIKKFASDLANNCNNDQAYKDSNSQFKVLYISWYFSLPIQHKYHEMFPTIKWYNLK